MKSILTTLALTLAASPAFANWTWNCTLKNKNHEYVMGVNATDIANPPKDASAVKKVAYTSTVKIDNANVPVLGGGCFVQDRPGTRFVRCSHQVGDTRLELYPVVQKTTGNLTLMRAILWSGATSTNFDLASCPPVQQ